MSQPLLFPEFSLPVGLLQDLRRMNPWWEGQPLPVLPTTRRHLVGSMQKRLERRVAPIVVVRGPRQIGKTTAQLQVLDDLLKKGVPTRNILRVQCDDLPELAKLPEPILRIVEWYEATVLQSTLNEAAHGGSPTYLFFDEVQNLKEWAPQLKHLVDSSTTQVIVTGSSALRIELGRDSLAGRISTLDAGVLSLTEIGRFHSIDVGEPFFQENGLEVLTKLEFWRELREHGITNTVARDLTFQQFSERGGYPLVHQRNDVPWPHLADQLNETVIKRVIQHDLRIGERGRKRDAPLLEEVFRLACRYAGQCPSPLILAREAQRALAANVGSARIMQYLRFLADTLLIRLIEPLEIRLKRKRGSPKICLADHGLRASWLQEVIPLAPGDLERNPHLTTIAGHLAESVAGATLATITSLDLGCLHARREDPEVDFVLTIGTLRIPLEVRYQRKIDPLRDTEGLRTFIEKAINNAPFGLLIAQTDEANVIDPRIVCLPLSSLMLLR